MFFNIRYREGDIGIYLLYILYCYYYYWAVYFLIQRCVLIRAYYVV